MSAKAVNPYFNYALVALAAITFIYLCRPILFNPDALSQAINSGLSIVAFVFSNLLIALWITLPVSLVYVLRQKHYPHLIRYVQYALLLAYCLYALDLIKAVLEAFRMGGLSGFFGYYHAYLLVMLDLTLLYLYVDNKPDKERLKWISLSLQSVLFLLIWIYSLFNNLMINTL